MLIVVVTMRVAVGESVLPEDCLLSENVVAKKPDVTLVVKLVPPAPGGAVVVAPPSVNVV
jgi:hypothetical protein